jgi:hypothetical protein
MTTNLHAPVLDLVIIAIYMAAILLVGIIAARRTVITGQVFFLLGVRFPGELSGRHCLPPTSPQSTSSG